MVYGGTVRSCVSHFFAISPARYVSALLPWIAVCSGIWSSQQAEAQNLTYEYTGSPYNPMTCSFGASMCKLSGHLSATVTFGPEVTPGYSGQVVGYKAAILNGSGITFSSANSNPTGYTFYFKNGEIYNWSFGLERNDDSYGAHTTNFKPSNSGYTDDLIAKHVVKDGQIYDQYYGENRNVPGVWREVPPPTAANETASSWKYMPVTIDLSVGATGTPTKALIVGSAIGGRVGKPAGTKITFTPTPGVSGQGKFQFQLVGTTGTSNTAMVTISPTLFSPQTKLICSSVSAASDQVSTAFEGASIGLEASTGAGGLKTIATNVAESIGTRLFTQLVSYNHEILGKAVDFTVADSQFIVKTFKHLTKTNPLSLAMEANALVFSAVDLLSAECANDPPDTNYKVVAAPAKLPILKTGNVIVDKLQVDYFNYVSLGGATIHAAERWEGANLAGATSYERLQEQAYTKYLTKMMAAKRVLRSDNLSLAKALPAVSIKSFPGGAQAMAAAFNAQCKKPLPADLNDTLLSLGTSQDKIDSLVCNIANSVSADNITTDFRRALRISF